MVACNYCGSVKNKIIFKGKPYSIVQCLQCDLSFLSPQPTTKELNKLYNTDYFHNTEIGSGYSDYSCLRHDLESEARRRLVHIQKYVKKGNLLDVGCGFGTFLVNAKNKGYTVTGCDISRDAIRNLKKNRINGVVADIASNKFPKGPFDVMTAWDVIEHVTNPRLALQAFYKAQARGGYLFMTTPDLHSIDAKILGKYWYGFKRIPEHLYYFTPLSISRLLKETGYEVVEIRTWGFQRNLAYCVEQVARYNTSIRYLLNPISKLLGFHNISFFFPFIDMLVIARKP